jgi:hypothetical protein
VAHSGWRPPPFAGTGQTQQQILCAVYGISEPVELCIWHRQTVKQTLDCPQATDPETPFPPPPARKTLLPVLVPVGAELGPRPEAPQMEPDGDVPSLGRWTDSDPAGLALRGVGGHRAALDPAVGDGRGRGDPAQAPGTYPN